MKAYNLRTDLTPERQRYSAGLPQTCQVSPQDRSKTNHRHVVSLILARYSDGSRFTAQDCRDELELGDYVSWLLPLLVKLNYLDCDRDRNGQLLGYRVA